MSSELIRDAARAMVVDGLWPVTLPFHETINEEPDKPTLPDLWCTVHFESHNDDRASIGGPGVALKRERGVVRVLVLGLTGNGDGAAITAADLARAVPEAFTGWPAGTTPPASSSTIRSIIFRNSLIFPGQV